MSDIPDVKDVNRNTEHRDFLAACLKILHHSDKQTIIKREFHAGRLTEDGYWQAKAEQLIAIMEVEGERRYKEVQDAFEGDNKLEVEFTPPDA